MKVWKVLPLLLITAFLLAQGGAPVTYPVGTVVTALNAVTATTPNPQVYIVSGAPSADNFTWTSAIAGGTATSITINLEGSIDYSSSNAAGAHWLILDSSTNTSGEGRSVFGKPVKFFRCNVTQYTANGTNETCMVIGVSE